MNQNFVCLTNATSDLDRYLAQLLLVFSEHFIPFSQITFWAKRLHFVDVGPAGLTPGHDMVGVPVIRQRLATDSTLALLGVVEQRP